MHVHVHVRVRVRACLWVPTCVHGSAVACVRVRLRACVRVRVRVRVCVQRNAPLHTRKRARAHAEMHAQVPNRSDSCEGGELQMAIFFDVTNISRNGYGDMLSAVLHTAYKSGE